MSDFIPPSHCESKEFAEEAHQAASRTTEQLLAASVAAMSCGARIGAQLAAAAMESVKKESRMSTFERTITTDQRIVILKMAMDKHSCGTTKEINPFYMELLAMICFPEPLPKAEDISDKIPA